jgi:2-keto-3-deoxy-6-phosphogluconate aldolase
MSAAVDGGFKLIEFTLTTPGALDSVAEFASRTDVMMGCGTIMNVQDAKNALDAGRGLHSSTFQLSLSRFWHEMYPK